MGKGLVGYWKLNSDCLDHSGYENHGKGYGSCVSGGFFDGRNSFIEISSCPILDFGTGDFTLCAWIKAGSFTDGTIGDVISKYDPVLRKGINLTVRSSSGGYNSQGDDRQIHFGIDDAILSSWHDFGRPSPGSNYISNSLTVYNGSLYAGITDAEKEEDWCHVFRYDKEKEWHDCGRVGNLKTRGVGPMIVHKGDLYAATWNYDWTRVSDYECDFCRVYAYCGDMNWQDCGQPGFCKRIYGIASFSGNLYVVGDDKRCHVYLGNQTWEPCAEFPNHAHPMAVHNGRLFAGVLNPALVFVYDGRGWKSLGNPFGSEEICNQIHAIEVFQGKLYATTWPLGKVAMLGDDEKWIDCGRLGDSTEINGLTVYNGKLYGGTIPHAEVFRYDGEKKWTSVGKFLELGDHSFNDLREWARVTSLTVYNGKLFAGMGSCTSSHLDAPCDFRGRVFAMEAGKCLSYGHDLGSDWNHICAIKHNNCLELYINGKKESISTEFEPSGFDLSNNRPLLIGFGETDYFKGRICEVRAYRHALGDEEVNFVRISTLSNVTRS